MFVQISFSCSCGPNWGREKERGGRICPDHFLLLTVFFHCLPLSDSVWKLQGTGASLVDLFHGLQWDREDGSKLSFRDGTAEPGVRLTVPNNWRLLHHSMDVPVLVNKWEEEQKTVLQKILLCAEHSIDLKNGENRKGFSPKRKSLQGHLLHQKKIMLFWMFVTRMHLSQLVNSDRFGLLDPC